MNRNTHRVVFNATRGLLMAVSEVAPAHGSGSHAGGQTTTTSTGRRPSCWRLSSLALALGWVGAAMAQIAADPTAPGAQRPTVLTAPNGVPLVNITTPSAAGVSRNTYSQFDVNAQGAILNNSRTDTPTQLGGWVQGNPWLATGGARVILNEVNSSQPTHLGGHVEVAGQQAEVVIANPAGIEINGGGFINASGVTLTTGAPVMSNGHLESFRVRGGEVRIDGLGLDTRDADQTRILTRAMQVNAGLWARELSVALGANDVPALASGTALQATPVAGTGPAPGFLLDVAALGGMYAGKITLVGTAAGLGVNNRGTLAADDGDWVLRTDGWLTNTGTIVASGNATAVVGGDIHNADSGLIAAGQNTSLDAAALRSDANAVLAAGLGADGQLNGTGTLDLNARQQIALQGQALAAGGLTAHTAGALVTDGAQLRAARIGLNAASLSNVGGEIAQSGGGTLTIHSTGTIDNTDGAILSDGGLAIHSAGTVTNLRGDMQAVGDARIDTAGVALDNTGGRITSQGALQVATGDITNRALGARAAQIGSSGDFTLTAAALSNGIDGATRSTLWSGQALNVRAQQLTNDGDIAGDTVLLQTQGDLTNSSTGTVSATQAIDIGADTFTNRGLVHANEAGGTSRVQLQATTVNNLGGAAIYGDRVAVAAHTLNNRPDAIDPVAPVIAARGQLDIGVQNLHNEDGALIYSGGDLRVGGGLDAATGYTTGAAQSVSNLSATIEAAGHLTIAADTLTNERRNANVHQATLLDQTAHLTMPSWWVNGQNEHGVAIEGTSNYSPHLFYLLDPASILSDEALVTPDGNVVHRIEVALDPADSIHFAASGAYAGNYGVRERVTVGAPTTAVLYVQQRTDNVTNPDQVPGSAHVFASSTASVTSWQRNTLNYSETYGRCSTNCTLLVVQPGYNDPQGLILRDTQRALTSTHAGLEVSRTARHTVVEDRLNFDAGAPAAVRAGGDMVLNVGTALVNRYADIQAGAGLDVQAGGASVTNEGQTLLRTHSFQVTSHTAAQGDFDWTAPEISEVVGHAGGTLSGAQQVSIAAQSLSNTDLARSTGLPANGLGFLGVSTPGPNDALSVPPSALLRPAAPDSAYLVEIDPRFTHHSLWLGSDYLLSALASDPAALHKRLGDGFFEQKLVREQVAQLTGRRFLPGHTSDEAQFLALMEAGVAHAQAWNLIPGVALSAEQMAQLTTDLVWLVERVVVLPDGHRTSALVPQVYVRQIGDGEITPAGALIAGENVRLDIAQDIVNNGGMLAGDSVLLQAGRDITHIGGLLQGGHTLVASAGRDVSVISTTHGTSFESTYVNQRRTELARVGALQAGDADGAALIVNAGRDVNLQGASVGNASTTGSTTIQAGRDVHLQTVTVGSSDNTEYNAKNYQRHSQRQEIGTNVQALGDAQLRAGNDVVARAANVNALGDLSVQAGNDITLQAGRAVSESATSVHIQRKGVLSKKSTEEVKRSASDVAQGSGFSGANVVLQAGQDIQIQGSSVNAQDLLLLDAGRDVTIASEQNTESGSYFSEVKKSGLSADLMDGVSYGKSRQNATQTYEAATQSGSSVTGGDVTVQAGRDAVVRSSVVIADTDLTVIAGRDVGVEAARDTLSSTNEAHAKSTTIGIDAGASGRFTAFGQTRSGQDGTSTSETAVQSLLSANAGNLTLIAGTDNQHQGTGAGNVNTQGGTLLAQDTVALSGNSVTLGTADSQSNSEFRAQSKNFTIGSQLSGVVGGLITQLGDAVQTARHTDNERLQAAAALKAGYDAYKLAGTPGADFTASAGTAAQPGDPGAAGIGISASIGSSKSRQNEQQTTTQQAGTVIQAGQIDIQAREGDLKAVGAKLQAQDIGLQAAGDIDLQAAKNTATLDSTHSGSSAGLGVTFGFGEQNGISFQVSASRARGSGEGSETTHDNAVVTATHTLTVRSGADTKLRGAQLAGDAVIADIGGNLNIQTLQDTSQYDSDQKSSGFSVSLCVPPLCYGNVVTGSVSTAKEQVDHDFTSVNQQSGIAAGAGGFDITVTGNTDLQGAAITSSATPDKNRLTTGSLTYSDLTNTQTTYAESESMSLGYGGAGLVATIATNVVGNVLANEVGERGLPENITQTSSTQSVISPANITVTGTDAQSAENVAALTNRDASTANQSLTNQLTLQQAQELKAQQQEARENQIAANTIGAVITNAIGDVAQAQGWPDGGWQKTALHGMAGLIQAKVAGTDVGKAVTAAMLNEQLTPVLADYLQGQGIDPRSPEFKTLMAAASTLLGSAFDAASVTYTATVNNYLKHADVESLEARLRACGDSQACRDKAFDDAYRTSVANDIELLNCKTTGNCEELKAAYRAGYAAIESMLDKGIKPDDVSLILDMESNAQTIIRRGLDQLQCNASACQDRANYLVGVGRGLAKVTPAGLVTGSGVMAYELTTAVLNLGWTDTAVALAQGIAGLPAELQQRLGSEDPQVRGEAMVDALAIGSVATVVTTKLAQTGYGATVRHVEAKALAAREAETIATRMREVAIHTDDARFSQVAQEIVSAERAGWKTADGKTWWPPENGKVPGTEQIVELKVGQKLDRYGETSNKSSFLAPAGTPLDQRALSDTTNTALHDVYIVKKPFSVQESRVMPWFGREGMGLQYETTVGTGMTINNLIRRGFLEKISP
ncbi:MAG: hemagglutinin repeat-containing protein [Hydrogenophaga sp.]|uniref:hemagglutinin repeat-containing protein n=1 Tax=Hydrogenophaga sp. TaxID=1904254 RepID=UPI002621BA0D|nr:hemagglutinin repeat-containing protein [Hydrogenophaga sp.]MCV0441107.1 hemagglutinin repeat-containing protein [Hydrogenophaga sp.]